MQINFEKIVQSQQNPDFEQFIQWQKEEIERLQDIQKRLSDGENIEQERHAIIESLKSAGILDDKGDFTEPYSSLQ